MLFLGAPWVCHVLEYTSHLVLIYETLLFACQKFVLYEISTFEIPVDNITFP